MVLDEQVEVTTAESMVIGGILDVAATGVDTEAGNDRMTTGIYSILADAEATSTVVFSLLRVMTLSSATGVKSGAGDDNVTVDATMTVNAEAFTIATEISIAPETFLIQNGSGTIADATGLAGGPGKDTLTNNQHLTVTANADSTLASVTLTPVELPADVFAIGDIPITATAKAFGISGGSTASDCDAEIQSCTLEAETPGVQSLDNNALLEVMATSATRDVSLSMSVSGQNRGHADMTADALAVAMIGGAGSDRITNTGSLDVAAVASSFSLLVDIQYDMSIPAPPGFLLEMFGAPAGEAETVAYAEAVGLFGGGGDDTITNNGPGGSVPTEPAEDCEDSTADICAEARVTSTKVGVTFSLPEASPESVGSVGLPSLAVADAQATAQDDAVPLTDIATRANSYAIGISGGAGDDTIINNSPLAMESFAVSTSNSVSVGINPSASSKLPFTGLSTAEGDTLAVAESIGISAGPGSDSIDNRAGLSALASSDAVSNAVVADINFDASKEDDADGGGFVLSTGFAQTSTIGKATTVGIDGSGGTEISNSGHVVAYSDAESDSTSVVVEVAINHDKGDLSLSGAGSFTQADSSAYAYSYGIDDRAEPEIGVLGGKIDNEGTIEATAKANAESTSASATLSYAYKGVSAGFTYADTGTKAYAAAAGITSDATLGPITNSGYDSEIHAEAEAIAKSTTLSLDVKITPKGGSFGGAVGLANTEAIAQAAGITTGNSDDSIVSDSTLTSKATAESTSGNYTVEVNLSQFGAGASYLEASTIADAAAVGISSGAGTDEITTGGLIDVDAIATTRANSVSINFSLLGAALAETSTRALSHAIGLEGGAGFDTITNAGRLEVDADSSMNDFGFTLNVTGTAQGDAAFYLESYAVGVDAGDRDDGVIYGNSILNMEGASITVLADSEYSSDSYVVQGGGYLKGKVGSITHAEAAGISGGFGTDTISNYGLVSATTSSTNEAIAFGFTLAGVQKIEADISAEATAIGIDASEGDNFVHNYGAGEISVHSKVANLAGSVGAGLLDFTFTTADADATVAAMGILTGAGDDHIYNLGSADVTASVFNDAGSGAIGLFAYSGATALSSAIIEGINAGAGNDYIENSGFLTVGDVLISDEDECIVNGVHYDSIACARAASVAFDLSSIVNTRLGAEATLAGIVGAGGDDTILNTESGVITVGDSEEWMVIGETDSIKSFLASGIDIVLAHGVANVDAVGISGGTGHDKVDNYGDINVSARSLSDVYAGGDTGLFTFTTAVINANASATALATGIAGDEGNDNLTNAKNLSVDAYAKGHSVSEVEGGIALDGLNSEAHADVYARAIGMDAGPGRNTVTNSNAGIMEVDAISETETSTFSDAGIGTRAKSELSTVLLNSEASGIMANSGDDVLKNFGLMTVTATAGKYGSLSMDAFAEDTVLLGPAVSNNRYELPDVGSPGVETYATATGLSSGDGLDTIINSGELEVVAHTEAWNRARTDSSDITIDDSADISVLSHATATGLEGSGEANTFINYNSLTVSALSAGNATAAIDTAENADADAWISAEAVSTGVLAGEGYATIDNWGTVETTARSTAYSYTNVNEGGGHTGIARASAINKADAIGLAVGDSGSSINNSGLLKVHAETAPAPTISVGDNVSQVNVRSEAFAAGVKAGAGENEIFNEGSVSVDAVAKSIATASDADTGDPDRMTARASSVATAIGISTGTAEGSDVGSYVWNSEDILVAARSEALSLLAGDADSETVVPRAESSAIGIRTGDGDDYIVNVGTILTSEVEKENFSLKRAASGIGIQSGSGNDQVFLGGDSVIDGSILLGAGNDLLALQESVQLLFTSSGTGMPGKVDGGEGIDTLRIDDRNSFNLAAPTSIENLDVGEGQLNVAGDYTLAPDGLLHISIYDPDVGELGYGQLVVTGDAILDGRLSVTALPRLYQNGETFDIMTAGWIDPASDFIAAELPGTPLVEFSLVDPRPADQLVQLQAAVQPFTAVALTPLQMTIAAYLDQVAPLASDELKSVLGSFQLTPEPGIGAALASLSPDSYQALSSLTFTNGMELFNGLQGHMHAIRSHMARSGFATLDRIPYMIAYNGSDAGVARLIDPPVTNSHYRGYLSLDGFFGYGDQDATQGYAGYDYTSRTASFSPQMVSGNSLFGISLGVSSTDVDFDDNRGDGDLSAWHVALYGSYYTDHIYFEGGLAYVNQEMDNMRILQIGDFTATATSEHDSDLYQGFFGMGCTHDLGEWSAHPSAKLQYAILDEEGFEESGAGDAGLSVDAETTASLFGEASLDLSKRYAAKSGNLVLDMSAGFRHDFDIDDRMVTATLQGAPGAAFTIDERGMERTSALLGAKLSFERDLTTAAIQYRGLYNNDYGSNMFLVTVGVKY